MNSADTPYSPPRAPLESNEPRPGHSLSPRALEHLAASAKWMQAAGICLIIAVVFRIASNVATAWEWGSVSAAMVTSAVFVSIANGAVLAWAMPTLFRSVRCIRQACAGGGDAEAALALYAHRLFWRRLALGVLILCGIAIAALLIFSAISRR